MIHIEQNQQLKDEPQMRVAVPSGDYNETDLIECYKDGEDPNIPTAMYQAQFIALGRHIYHQSEELTEDQLNALLANVPADQVINNRKMMDGKKPAARFVGKIVQRKGRIGKRELRADVVEDTQQATTTPPVQTTPTQTMATSTPTTTNTSTSTPVDTNTATTTPVDTSTSTPAFISTSTPVDTTATTTATSTSDYSDDEIASSTPNTDTSTTTNNGNDTSTSTPVLDNSTQTPTSTPAVEPSTDSTATSSEIVAFAKSYAKKKILKR